MVIQKYTRLISDVNVFNVCILGAYNSIAPQLRLRSNDYIDPRFIQDIQLVISDKEEGAELFICLRRHYQDKQIPVTPEELNQIKTIMLANHFYVPPDQLKIVRQRIFVRSRMNSFVQSLENSRAQTNENMHTI